MIDLVASLAAYGIASCEALQVDVHHTGVRPLAVREAVDAAWEGDPCGSHPRLRLHLRDEAGASWSMPVQPTLTVWVAGFTATEATDADAAVTGMPARVALEPRGGRPVREAGPWRSRGPLRKGQVLTDRVVSPMPAARRGARVDVVVQRGSVRLSVPGRLLADGHVGQSVRVRHEATDRVVTGRLSTPTTVEIP